MGRILAKDVKEKLSKGESFSVFVYLEKNRFVYDTELNEGCIGVISSDIGSLFDMTMMSEDEVIDEQIAQAKRLNQPLIKQEYAGNEAPTDENFISVDSLVSGNLVISVVDLKKAKSFDKNAIEERMIEFLKQNNKYVRKVTITNDADLSNDLGFDSLELIEFVMEIEKEFGVQIPDNVTEIILFSKKEFRTIKWISSFLFQQIEVAEKLVK